MCIPCQLEIRAQRGLFFASTELLPKSNTPNVGITFSCLLYINLLLLFTSEHLSYERGKNMNFSLCGLQEELGYVPLGRPACVIICGNRGPRKHLAGSSSPLAHPRARCSGCQIHFLFILFSGDRFLAVFGRSV